MDYKKTSELCYHTFNTPMGREFLAFLKASYFDQCVYLPGMTFDQVAYNEGKRHVVDQILAWQHMFLTGEYPETHYEGEDEYGGDTSR